MPSATPRARAALLAAAAAAILLILPGTAGAATGGATEPESVPSEPAGKAPAGKTPFDRQGMWIWYVSRAHGGSVGRIVARAKRSGVGTLYVKAGDAGNTWSQFSPSLVRRLKRAGLDVCAWQFVYGSNPVAEARAAAVAIARGADCFVIDAEGHYEGRYAAADRYVRILRRRAGPDYPISLASFPYVDYHPSFPYSVFFGPGGATYNQPQMYWKTIGTSVRRVYEHTYLFNRLWGHPIYPLGQTYDRPGRVPVKRFRRFARNYGGLQPSWWEWDHTPGGLWRALRPRLARISRYRPVFDHPLLKRGSRGDLVVWAQQHLRGAGLRVPVTGFYGRLTRRSVIAFQRREGMRADGVIGTRTWNTLLEHDPVRVSWARRAARRSAALRSGAATASQLSRSAPLSASLPARAYEIDPGPRP